MKALNKPLARGAIGCTAPTTNLAEPTRNLLNIKDRRADQILGL